MITNLNWYFENLKTKTPFAFARFNDGEMMGIDKIGSIVARGDQLVDKTLHEALKEALAYKQKNYYKGVPCSICFPKYFKLAKDIVGDYDYLTSAVITTNRNWMNFLVEFPRAMSERKMHWISGADQNIGCFRSLNIQIDKFFQVPQKNSWNYYEEICKEIPQHFKPGDVVGISLGPTARVLVRKWFEEYSDVTFLDMGSNFDPFTRNVRHNCHKGWESTGFNLTKRCAECN